MSGGEEHDLMEELHRKTFYRYMSEGEAEAVRRSGLLRGGRRGRTYWTTDLYEGAGSAKNRLALAYQPEARVRFRITNAPTLLLSDSPVAPDAGEPGGGTEYMSEDTVEVEVLAVDYLE